MFHEYKVSDDALKQARTLGMFGNVRARLAKMAKLSAPFTHPDANRRYEGYLLSIKDDVLVAVTKHTQTKQARAKPKQGPNIRRREEPDPMMVTCPDCNDDGGPCVTCNNTGKLSKAKADELGVADNQAQAAL